MGRGPGVVLAGLLLALGCDEGQYDVVVRFDPPALADGVDQLEVALVPGGCDAVVLGEAAAAPARVTLYRRGVPLPPVGEVDPGRQGLYVRGLAACNAVAAGCREFVLEAGGSGELAVTATSVSGAGCPIGTECTGGECVPLDAGAMDAGVDAGPDVDGGPRPDGPCGECAPGETQSCAGTCGEDGTQTCNGSCAWGPCTVVPSTDTVALWTFDGAPDAMTITDAAGDHDGVMVGGTASFVPGPLGCGEALGATGAAGVYGEVADAAEFDLDEGAIDFWVRFGSTGARTGILSRDASGTTLPGHLSIWREATGEIGVRLQTAAGDAERCTATPVRDNRWIHVNVRFGAPDLELVVDGIPAAPNTTCTGSTADGIAGNDNPWVLGALAWVSDEGAATPVEDPLHGALDHVRVTSTRAPADAPRIAGFVLVDSIDDSSLGVVRDGDVLDTGTLPAGFTIRALTDPAEVGSVAFVLDGDTAAPHVEGRVPYGASGDDDGDYNPWTPPPPGEHVFEVTAYSGPSQTGTAGPTRTLRFTIR